jgi:hypothetical protein
MPDWDRCLERPPRTRGNAVECTRAEFAPKADGEQARAKVWARTDADTGAQAHSDIDTGTQARTDKDTDAQAHRHAQTQAHRHTQPGTDLPGPPQFGLGVSATLRHVSLVEL